MKNQKIKSVRDLVLERMAEGEDREADRRTVDRRTARKFKRTVRNSFALGVDTLYS